VGWAPFLRAVVEVEDLARPEAVDVRAELVGRWPAMRSFAPALLEASEFEGSPGTGGLLGAVALLRGMNAAGKGNLPPDAPAGFVRRGWRPFMVGADENPDRRAREVCVLAELRDRLRAGDVWVRGSRRYRRFENLLLPRPTLAALRAEGPLPTTASPSRPTPRPAGAFRATSPIASATNTASGTAWPSPATPGPAVGRRG
jgi:hypothetical protein